MKPTIVCILGRQPALGLAELESLFGADKIFPTGSGTVLVEADIATFPFSRLGGVMKACKLLTMLPQTDWGRVSDYLIDNISEHLQYIPEGKIRLGLSSYGVTNQVRKIQTTALQLKKVIKREGRSIRVIPNTAPELNAAQILHNQLTGPTGMELVLIRDGGRTILAQTFAVQDIDAYAARDQRRPMRDTRVGMLPPKLAQIIINLATGPKLPNTEGGFDILDPFCGTGVVLQEALLMGFKALGSDLDPRMVEYSTKNLEWLTQTWRAEFPESQTQIGDATNLQWQPFGTIACETYLGRPFSATPAPAVLQEVMNDVNLIHKRFLQNVARQTAPGFRLCIAVPAWKTPQGFKHLKVLDFVEDLGYTRQSFVHANREDLIYFRPDQIVARELVVIIRK